MADQTNPEVTQGADGQQTLGWKTELPESLRSHEAFAPYKTKNDLWNGHIQAVTQVKDLEGKLKNSIPKLAENATDEQRAAFRKATNVPEKPEGYEFPEVDGRPNSPEVVKWASGEFHRLNIPANEGKELAISFNKFFQGVFNAEAEKSKEATRIAEEGLKKEYGDKYNAYLELRNRFWEKHVKSDGKTYESLEAWLNKPRREGEQIGNDPFLNRLLFNLMKKTGEDTGLLGIPQGGQKDFNDPRVMYPEMYQNK